MLREGWKRHPFVDKKCRSMVLGVTTTKDIADSPTQSFYGGSRHQNRLIKIGYCTLLLHAVHIPIEFFFHIVVEENERDDFFESDEGGFTFYYIIVCVVVHAANGDFNLVL